MKKLEMVKVIGLFFIAVWLIKWYALIMLVPIGWFILVEKLKFDKSKYKLEAGITLWEVLSDRGKYGEYLTFVEIEKLTGEYRIVTNAYLPKEDGGTSEIDVVLIHASGIFVLESKNYSGWIFGNENQEKWTATYGKYRKQRFHNPVWQNATHIKWLEKCLEVGSDSVYSIIVFSERCNIKKIKLTKKNTIVLQRQDLTATVRSIVGKNKEAYSKEQMDKMYYALKRCTYKTDTEKQKHIDDIVLHKSSVHYGKIMSNQPEKSAKVVKKDKSYITTTKLYLELKDENAVAKQLGLQTMTVQEHIVKAYKEGFEMDIREMITEEHEKLVMDAISKVGRDKLKAIKDAVPVGIGYLEIKLVLAKY
ncbi:MAG: hypothetical protein A2Y18_05170 [Clostridiales bacterium GWD2_32_19]|nr:MAG: hypothetical protein A2Y18_05170 [Clostridiales bacterium GWD2_32_19]